MAQPLDYVPNDFNKAADAVADTVSQVSDAASDRVKRLASDAKAGVRRAADYVRDSGVQDFGSQVKDYVKANPSYALVGAVAVGFVLGRLMTKD